MPDQNGRFVFQVKDSDFKRSGWCGNRPRCVEVASKPEGIAVRDSKDPNGPVLFFTHEEFRAFANGVKDGEFDV